MRNPTAAALLLALAASASTSAPAARADDGDWVTIRNELGTVELVVPPGFQEMERKKANLDIYIQYENKDFKRAFIRVFAHQGYTKPEHIKDYMKFVESDVGGTPTYEEGSTTKFTTEKPGDENMTWVLLVEGRVVGGYGIYFLAQIPKPVYEETKDTWKKVWDSLKTTGPVPDSFEVPGTWKLVKNDMYAVIGPVSDIKDKKLKEQFENRLFRVQTWLDPLTSPAVKMFREFTGDSRKYPPRQVVRVLPTVEAFKKEAGARWTAGATVVYLPDEKDRRLIVDGSPDSALDEQTVDLAAGIQYLEGRLGKLAPWMRVALEVYFENGLKKKQMLGVLPPESLKRGKEVFAARPATFEDLQKKDDAGMAELGEPGRVAAWGILQAGLHGDDGPARTLFRRFFKDAVGAADLNVVWEKAVAAYQEESKKKFKPKDIDTATKKYFKDLKEEKK